MLSMFGIRLGGTISLDPMETLVLIVGEVGR
jgi:hypothetical protein